VAHTRRARVERSRHSPPTSTRHSAPTVLEIGVWKAWKVWKASYVESAAAQVLHAELRVVETKLSMMGNSNDPVARELRDELTQARDLIRSDLRFLEKTAAPIYDPQE
jgi:hypothetical protein